MAAQVSQTPYRPWSFEKAETRLHESPASDMSASTFLESPDRLRVTPTMEEIRGALKDNPDFDQAYQSSEEALSPLLDEDEPIESSQNEADDELDTAEEFEGKDGLWEELGIFKIDMAVAISVVAVGRPKIINVPSRWAKFRRPALNSLPHDDFLPSRSDSLPPNIPSRSRARTPGPPLDTRFSTTSMPLALMAAGNRSSVSPESIYSITGGNREASIFSLPNSATGTAMTPPMSEHGSDSPSFLQSDPFENVQPFKRQHSRLRGSFSKLKFNSKQQSPDDAPLKTLKRERRVSLIRRPATPSSFFDNRSSSESNTESNASSQPIATVPLRSTPSQRFPKRVARGANEREPTISLPPCPDFYDQEPRSVKRSQTDRSERSIYSSISMKRRSTLGLG